MIFWPLFILGAFVAVLALGTYMVLNRRLSSASFLAVSAVGSWLFVFGFMGLITQSDPSFSGYFGVPLAYAALTGVPIAALGFSVACYWYSLWDLTARSSSSLSENERARFALTRAATREVAALRKQLDVLDPLARHGVVAGARRAVDVTLTRCRPMQVVALCGTFIAVSAGGIFLFPDLGAVVGAALGAGAIILWAAQRRVRLSGVVERGESDVLVQVVDALYPEFVILKSAQMSSAPLMVSHSGERWAVVREPHNRYTMLVLDDGERIDDIGVGSVTGWYRATLFGSVRI